MLLFLVLGDPASARERDAFASPLSWKSGCSWRQPWRPREQAGHRKSSSLSCIVLLLSPRNCQPD